jgi:hypothetical protein
VNNSCEDRHTSENSVSVTNEHSKTQTDVSLPGCLTKQVTKTYRVE